MQTASAETTQLVVKRVLNAPVARVYEAWANPEHLVKWFAPNERWRTPLIDVENRPGGRHNITMRHSDGEAFCITGAYVEIVPNRKLSFTWIWPENAMSPNTGETLVTVEFREVAGGTEVTLTHERMPDAGGRLEAVKGWEGCLENLAGYITQGKVLLPAD